MNEENKENGRLRQLYVQYAMVQNAKYFFF